MKQIVVLERTIFIFLSVNGFGLYMEFFHQEFVSTRRRHRDFQTVAVQRACQDRDDQEENQFP